MNLNPRSYRVPVLRLTDVYQGDSVNGDPAQGDILEPNPGTPQNSSPQPGVGSAGASQTPAPLPPQHSALTDYVPEEPVAPQPPAQEKDDYVGEPVPDFSHITYTPTNTKTEAPSAKPGSVPLQKQEVQASAPKVQAVSASPWTINPAPDRPDTLAAVPIVETAPPPPPPPPKPAVAPLKKPEDPFKRVLAPDLPDMWEVAASKPVSQTVPGKPSAKTVPEVKTQPASAPVKKVPENPTQNFIDQALAGMGLGGMKTPATPAVSTDTAPPVQVGDNLAALRMRVQDSHAQAEAEGQQNPMPAPVHVPETEHAKVLADVAHTLHTIHDSTSLTPDVPRMQKTAPQETTVLASQIRHADFLEEDLVVTPAQKEGPSSPVPMIRTFKADVENAITHNQVSMVKMIADEEKRRHEPQEKTEIRRTKKRHVSVRTYMLVVGSLILLGITVALGFFISSIILNSERRETTSEIFFSDAGREFDVTGKDRATIMKGLTDLRDTIDIGLGETAEIRIIEQITTPESEEKQTVPVTASAFLTLIQSRAPDHLLRTLHDSFIFGIHRDQLGKRHPFFIFKARTFGIAYPGMLEWERGLDVDLAPLFGIPVDRALLERAAQQVPRTTTGTSSLTTIDLGQIGLYDDIDVSNQATRVLRNLDAEIQLLWTIIPGKDLLIITTNTDTFREVVRRM